MSLLRMHARWRLPPTMPVLLQELIARGARRLAVREVDEVDAAVLHNRDPSPQTDPARARSETAMAL